MSVGKAVNQLITQALMDLKYIANPETCEHVYEWLPIHGSTARRFACKNCLSKPKGELPKNIVYFPGFMDPPRDDIETIPQGARVTFANPNDLPEVEEEIV